MLDRWNRAIAEIEARVAETGEPVDVAALARTALTSEHHVRRVFSALAGMPLSDYVRRRRLSLATAEVVAGAGVLDVAVRHGYGPTADGVLLGRVQQLWAEAVSQWFPANPYQVLPGPEILRLTYADDGATGHGELRLPVEHVPG